MIGPCSGEWAEDADPVWGDTCYLALSVRIDEFSIDPDDPATAGCLLALLGSERHNVTPGSAIAADGRGWWAWLDGEWLEGLNLGRACIAAAAALGRWPGGAS